MRFPCTLSGLSLSFAVCKPRNRCAIFPLFLCSSSGNKAHRSKKGFCAISFLSPVAYFMMRRVQDRKRKIRSFHEKNQFKNTACRMGTQGRVKRKPQQKRALLTSSANCRQRAKAHTQPSTTKNDNFYTKDNHT